MASGTHFGFWYRMNDNSNGPSFSPNYCPKKIPMGIFTNNLAHTIGRFGLWVFPGFTPTISGKCSDSRPLPARFVNFTSYNCDKGAEYVMATPMQFVNFVVWDHASAGIESKQMANMQDVNTPYISILFNDTTGSTITDSVVIGDSRGTNVATLTGVVVSWDRGLLLKNIAFYNFPNAESRAIMPTLILCRCV